MNMRLRYFFLEGSVPLDDLSNHHLQAAPSLLLKHGPSGYDSAGSKFFKIFSLLGAGTTGLLSLATVSYAADEAEHGLECPNYPWPHKGILSSYDHAS